MHRSVLRFLSLVVLAIAPSVAAARTHQMVIIPGEDRDAPLHHDLTQIDGLRVHPVHGAAGLARIIAAVDIFAIHVGLLG